MNNILREIKIQNLQQPGSVEVKHRGLWSPWPQFESGPGYYFNKLKTVERLYLIIKYLIWVFFDI